MSSTITYKGSTLTTVNNQTRTLLTRGTWLEDNLTITDVTSGGSVTITDEINATGTTCVITSGSTPTPTPDPTPTPSGDIPLNTELIDFSAVENDMLLDNGSGQTFEYEWASTSDYTEIDPSMTFSYIGWGSGYVCFYDSTKTYLTYLSINQDGEGDEYGVKTGTLTPAKIPATAKYVRINSLRNPDSSELSLIRTA